MASPTGEKYKKSDVLGYAEGFARDYKPEELPRTPRQPALEEELYRMKKERERLVIARQAMPRLEEQPIEELRLKSEKVMGNIFDRVRFLEARIGELEENIALRTKIHNEIAIEIEKDVEEKNRLADVISDMNERRNLKLDVSVLRKEKRHETVQFWKDVMELTLELRQLREQHETEKKIASLFAEGDGK